jgi:hypothetical protein
MVFIARPAPRGRTDFYPLMKPAARSEARAAASMIASESMP